MRTKGKWKARGEGYISSDALPGGFIAVAFGKNVGNKIAEANAEFICKAVNSQEPLREALENLLKQDRHVCFEDDCGHCEVKKKASQVLDETK